MCERCGNPACKGSEAVAALFATVDDPELVQLVFDTLDRLAVSGLNEDQKKHFAAVAAVVQEMTVRFSEAKVEAVLGKVMDAVLGSAAGLAGVGAAYQRVVNPRRRRPQPVGTGLRRARAPRRKDS